MKKKLAKFLEEGVRFECQGSGNCCVSRGGYGHVFLTLEDRRRLGNALGIKTQAFTKKYCELKNEVWALKEESKDCVFLKDKRCSVYKARPTQCRTWPFWPEVLNPRTWNGEVASFCPGVGKGRLWKKAEIEKQLNEQIESENQYGT